MAVVKVPGGLFVGIESPAKETQPAAEEPKKAEKSEKKPAKK